MIVKDSNATPANLKSSYAPISARAVGESSSNFMAPPPTYDASQSPFFGYRSGTEPAGRRFWRALAVALIVWFLLGMLVRSIVDLALVHRHHKHGGLAKDYPEFESGEALQCIDRPDWTSTGVTLKKPKMPIDLPRPPYYSSTSFSLPPDADLLYFLSRGSLAYGTVRFELSSGTSADDNTVQVDVGVWYWSAEALERASVCALERHEHGEHYGVGIFTPRSWHGRSMRDRMYFEVVVRLPPRNYVALETDYENFALDIADLQGSAVFEKLHLKTSNGHIAAESLEAQEGSLKSSNGAISGKYNVSHSLQLVTSNAKIDADIDMYSENSHYTSLLLKTSNAPIDSNLSLNGPSLTSAFAVQALTSNAPSLLHITSHPHSSPLTLEMRTSNARARAALHPSFEGPFRLRTSNANPALRAGNNGETEDPSGEGRERGVEIARQVRGVMEGKVWWGEWTGREKGWVHVTSSNAPVELDLTGYPAW